MMATLRVFRGQMFGRVLVEKGVSWGECWVARGE